MILKLLAPTTFLKASLWFLLTLVSSGTDTDIQCLKSFKASINDPSNHLKWDFSNATEGFICTLLGVECWRPDENRVLRLHVSNLGLSGNFPSGLGNCTSLNGLDLSKNNFFGPIPSDVSSRLPFVTNLDLSYNKFDGSIPADLAKCSYLNKLNLQHNRLNGAIPAQLSQLSRLDTLNLADNLLSGQIPQFNDSIITHFENNPGLCGQDPYENCNTQKKSNITVIVGAACGGFVVAAVVVLIFVFFLRKAPLEKQKDDDGNKWVRDIKGSKGIKVWMFGDTVIKMKLSDLMKATNNFSSENIIHVSRMGTMYKASLTDGTLLTIKRLHESQHNEKQFLSEMATLGNIRHRDLVPLLGYCIAKKERLLVYKHMSNGTLYDLLHRPACSAPEWPLRLKICIAAARGLAWLHHSCNPPILHRNISSKCIFLDDDYEPRISNLGLAHFINPVDTHLSSWNAELGDLGYVDPDYTNTLVAKPKGDVYSFGVVILELVTREKATEVTRAPEGFRGSLVEWITYLSNSSLLQDAIDKSLIGKGCDDELMQVLKLACTCVLSSPKERPAMYEVYQILRVVGKKYNFSIDNDLALPSQVADTSTLE